MVKNRWLSKIFNDISTRNKLIISYIFIVFLPVLVVGLLLTNSMRQMALDRAVSEATENVERVRKRVSEVLKVSIDVSTKLNFNRKIEEIALGKYESTWDAVVAYWNYGKFDDVEDFLKKVYNKELKDIRLFVDNDTLLENYHFFKVTDSIREKDWYKEALQEKQIVWNYVYNDFNQLKPDYYLSLTRVVFGSSGAIGVMVIDIDRDNLTSILNQESFHTFLIDTSGRIVAAKDNSIIGKNIEVLQINKSILENKDRRKNISYKGKPSKMIIEDLSIDGKNGQFKVVSIFSIDSILESSNKASIMGFTIITVSLILSLLIILIISNALSKRIRMLSIDMSRVAQGDFSTSSSIEGKDEIGHLARDLDKMAKSLDELVNQVYEANLQKKQLSIKQRDIKLKMLANQVNPHFLFNSLETIRMKAHCRGEEEIAETVRMLGGLLRRGLEVGSREVPLETELELIKDYLEIQRFRFGDKIDYLIKVYDNINGYMILPLILQPIVENAVIHGIEEMEAQGNISIELKKDADFLNISVSDNGVGMTETRLCQVISSLDDNEEDEGKRIGVRNVHQRIKLYYGENYGIKIESKENSGTKIDILLPWQRQ